MREVAWKKAHPERTKELNRQSWLRNVETIREKNRKWYEANRPSYRAADKRFAKLNPEKMVARTADRRAKKYRATPAWANRFFIREAFHLAHVRTIATGIKWHVDHIVPLKSPIVCGLHAHTNVQVISAAANSRKSNVSWPDMP